MSQTSSINRRGTTDRKARARERLAVSKSPAIRAGLEGGQYQPLSDSDIERVHQAALEVLATTGIGGPTEELLNLVLPKGAEVNKHGRL
ncbi:MAG: hypothetical protein ACO3N2_02705 [Arenicellales bacterium]